MTMLFYTMFYRFHSVHCEIQVNKNLRSIFTTMILLFILLVWSISFDF